MKEKGGVGGEASNSRSKKEKDSLDRNGKPELVSRKGARGGACFPTKERWFSQEEEKRTKGERHAKRGGEYVTGTKKRKGKKGEELGETGGEKGAVRLKKNKMKTLGRANTANERLWPKFKKNHQENSGKLEDERS